MILIAHQASIAGYVVDANTDHGIPYVVVTAEKCNDAQSFENTSADGNGFYYFQDLDVGEYILKFTVPHFLQSIYGGSAQAPTHQLEKILVSVGDSGTPILDPSATVALQATSLVVEVVKATPPDSSVTSATVSVLGIPRSAITSETGQCFFPGLPCGELSIRVTDPKLAKPELATTYAHKDLTEGQENQLIIVMDDTPRLNGRVTTRSGGVASPITNATVRVWRNNIPEGLCNTNAKGEFSLTGLPVGDVSVHVSARGFKPITRNVSLTKGVETKLDPIELEVLPS